MSVHNFEAELQAFLASDPDNELDMGSGNVLKGDVVAESTSGAGVTVDGVLLKDNAVDLNGAGSLILDADADTTINSATDDLIIISAGGSSPVKIRPTGLQDNGTEAITATTGGGTTGLITQGTKHVTVTSDSATKQISLPAATVGDEIWITVGATGCELISAVAAHTVNNVVVGTTNELALVATSTYHCKYVAANTWIVRGFTNLGADEAALVPDAL